MLFVGGSKLDDNLPKAHYIVTCCAKLIIFWNEWWSLFCCYFGLFHVVKFELVNPCNWVHCLRVWLMMQIAHFIKETLTKGFIVFLRSNWNVWNFSQNWVPDLKNKKKLKSFFNKWSVKSGASLSKKFVSYMSWANMSYI